MSKILLADSGSTKTDWCLVDMTSGSTERYATLGINPFLQSKEDIAKEVSLSLYPNLRDVKIDNISFYGAGCANEEKKEIVRSALAESFNAKIEVESDLLAAARSLCGHAPGIACILGTGSNSCQYDGKVIMSNVSPLGYVLGDEGGGCNIGKRFIGDVLKRQLSDKVCDRFFQLSDTTQAEILDNVYKKPFPNRYLASFSPIVLQLTEEPEVRSLVEDCFDSFFKRNVMQYDYQRYSVNFIGSIAIHFESILRSSAEKNGIRIGKIQKSPMPGLIEYIQASSKSSL